MKSKLFIISVIVEVVGIAALGLGIGVELTLGADLGYILISVGALVVAGGGLLFAKFVRREK
jgi:hypothetical protein